MLPTDPSSNNSSLSALQAWGNRGCGRSILANGPNRALLDKFLTRSAEQSNDGLIAQELIKAINSLRGAASPLNSMLKPGSPTRRLVVAGHFEIEYELNSYYGELQTDIEIVDIRLKEKAANDLLRPALWDVSWDKDGWRKQNDAKPALTVVGDQIGNEAAPIMVGINGKCESFSDAINTIPDHMAQGDGVKLGKIRSGYQLYFVPTNLGGSRGWLPLKTLGKKQSSEQIKAASILASHIYDAHKRKLHVEWTSHDCGSEVLTKAMGMLIQKNVDLEKRQRIYLSDHTTSEYEADLCRRALNMDISAGNWANSRPGVRQIIGGKQFGYATLSSKYLVLTHATPANEKWGTLAEFGLDTFSTGKAWKGAIAASAALHSGVSFGVGALVLTTFGEALLASIPKLNNNYYKGFNNQVKVAINKLINRG